jgi:hypothetical protein
LLRRSADGTLTKVAGGGAAYYWTEGMRADLIDVMNLDAYAIAPNGDSLFSKGAQVWRLGDRGVVHAIGGTGKSGYSGDGGPASQARMRPSCLLARPEGGILMCDGTRIRLLDAEGRVWRVAGGPRAGFGGDGGPASGATLMGSSGLHALPGGGFLISDGQRIRRVESLTLPPPATPSPNRRPLRPRPSRKAIAISVSSHSRYVDAPGCESPGRLRVDDHG